MTELEFMIDEMIGSPVRRKSNGESVWPKCPKCRAEESFRTLPVSATHKHRAKCWECGFFGDVHDVMRVVNPERNYLKRNGQISLWRAEYADARKRGDFDDHSSSPPRGPRSTEGTCRRCLMREEGYDPSWDFGKPETVAAADEVDEAVQFLRGSAAAGRCLTAVAVALRLAHERSIHPLTLAEQVEARVWTRKHDREHMAECDDPACDWYCCVESRGDETEPRTPDD